MKKTFYEIREYNAQIPIRRRSDLNQLKPACASDDTDPALIASFETEAEARKHYDSLISSVDIKDAWAGGKLAIVTEYALECVEHEIDEDGDIEYSDIIWQDFASFPAEIWYSGEIYEYNRLGGWMAVEEDGDDDE